MIEGLTDLYSLDLSILIWPIVSIIIVVVLTIIFKMVIKKKRRDNEREEMNKYMELLFEKYSEIIVDRIVKKLKEDSNENKLN